MSSTLSTQRGAHEIDAIVDSADLIADDVVRLTFRAVGADDLPEWEPGAHVDVVLGDDLVRQYSLCGPLRDRGSYSVAVLRETDGRGGSAAAHALTSGTAVHLRGPRNNFAFEPSEHYLFIAGGIGVTPLLPMIEAAEAAGADWELHYVGRRLSSMAFADQLAAYGDRVKLIPRDQGGALDLDSLLAEPRHGTLVYCCGPERLITGVESAAADWPARSVRTERFVAGEIDHSEDTAFDVVLTESDMTLRVEPGATIFETMRAAGVTVLGSCLEGICGTCEQTVLEGEVDHRDSVLDDDEKAANDCMMVCVSRCKGPRLVLEA